MNLQQNNFSFSNQPSSRRSSQHPPRLSKESTSKSIRLDSTRDEQSVVGGRSYKRLHSRELKQLSEDPAYQRAQLDKLQIKSAIRIQRFWRFYLLMRRKVQDDLLRKLSLDCESLERVLRNEEIREDLLHRELDALKSSQENTVKQLLVPSKHLTIEFAQQSVLHSVGRGAHLQNLRLAASYQQRELQNNLSEYRKARDHLQQLQQQRQHLLSRQQQLTDKVASLTQQLLQENAHKSRLQCQCDQLQLENARLRCS